MGIFIRTALIGVVCLVVNILIYKIPGLGVTNDSFVYPLPMVYLFFVLFSEVILYVLIRISKKNKEQMGYAFLLLTAVKMIFSYILVRPILEVSKENPTEKVNFFAIFILFLAIEAYYTARLLNNKQ